MRGLEKIFYIKGNSVKRSGPFSQPPDSECWKVAVLIPFPKISSYLQSRAKVLFMRIRNKWSTITPDVRDRSLQCGCWAQSSQPVMRIPQGFLGGFLVLSFQEKLRVHAKGVILCERTCCASYRMLPSKNLVFTENPLQAPSKNPSKKHLLLKSLLRTLLRSVLLHDPLGVHPI